MRTSEPDFEPGTLNAYVISSNEVLDGDHYGYKVIAVIHEGYPAWSAYQGPTSWSDFKVAQQGDIVSEEIAKLLFPALAATYRIYYT